MQSNNIGKASTHFYNKAEELGNIVLSNKTLQTTRFVRSFLRGLTAALRNLPTLQHIVAEEFEIAAFNFENTKAKEAQKILDGLMDAETLFLTAGLCQLLDSYSEVSLQAQYTSQYPIQVWQRIEHAKAELEQLQNGWTWKNCSLKLAGIGSPFKIIESIMNDPDSKYVPYVPLGSIRKNKSKIKNFDELLADNDLEENELFDEEKQQVLELSGREYLSFISSFKIFSYLLRCRNFILENHSPF